MKPQAKRENIVVQTTNDETLIYDLAINKAFLLNETSAFIWQMSDGTRDVAELSSLLAEKFKQKADINLVWLAIEQLRENELLTNAAQMPAILAGSSRREVIKQIGLSTMLALPLVTALVAPKAVNAASGNTCQTGVCYPGGTSQLCAACFGRNFNINYYNSTDGSCSGGLTYTGGFSCFSASETFPNDIRVNSILS